MSTIPERISTRNTETLVVCQLGEGLGGGGDRHPKRAKPFQTSLGDRIGALVAKGGCPVDDFLFERVRRPQHNSKHL